MIGIVYLGNNPQTEERLKYIPGRLVQLTKTYKDAASACAPHVRNEHFIVFYEKNVRSEDITAITYLRKKCSNIYIILLTDQLTAEERDTYQKCGINDTLNIAASVTELNKKIQFISDRESIMFDDQVSKKHILRFKIPLWKRLFDIFFSGLAIIFLSPVFILTAIAIKLEDHGPVFYRQTRLTRYGRKFDIIKFRSMRCDAEKDGVARLAGDNDDRITRVGAIIRKCRIDELPQIFNIFLGQMSMVGPRPERPEIAKEYEEVMPEFALRLQVKAGLTGYAQVYGKYNTTPYDKVQMDLIYVARQSFMEDIRLMLMTFKILFVPSSTEGVDADQRTAQRRSAEKDAPQETAAEAAPQQEAEDPQAASDEA